MRLPVLTAGLLLAFMGTQAQADDALRDHRFCQAISKNNIAYQSMIFDVTRGTDHKKIEQAFTTYLRKERGASVEDWAATCLGPYNSRNEAAPEFNTRRTQLVREKYRIEAFPWNYEEITAAQSDETIKIFAFCVTQTRYKKDGRVYYSPLFEKSFDASLPAMEKAFQRYLDDEYGMKDYKTTCKKANSMKRAETLMDISAIEYVSWPVTVTNWRYKGTISSAEKPDRPARASSR